MFKYALPVAALAAASVPASAATFVFGLGGSPASQATSFVFTNGGETLKATAATYTVAPTALDLLSELQFGQTVRQEAGGLGVNSGEAAGEREQVDTNGVINEVLQLTLQGRGSRLVSAKFNFVDADDTLRVYGVRGNTLTLLGLTGSAGFTGEFVDNTSSDAALGNGAKVTAPSAGPLSNSSVFDVSFDPSLGSYNSFLFTSRNNAADGYRLQQISLAVPEPATWAMMIGGFGVLGAAARRRNRAQITYA